MRFYIDIIVIMMLATISDAQQTLNETDMLFLQESDRRQLQSSQIEFLQNQLKGQIKNTLDVYKELLGSMEEFGLDRCSDGMKEFKKQVEDLYTKCPIGRQCPTCPAQRQCPAQRECPAQRQCPFCPPQRECPFCPAQKVCPVNRECPQCRQCPPEKRCPINKERNCPEVKDCAKPEGKSFSCNARQIQNSNGTCRTCPQYFKANKALNKCETQYCNDKNMILQSDGTCKMCPRFSRPSADGKSCRTDWCDKGQVYDRTGKCKQCPVYQRPMKDNACMKKETVFVQGTQTTKYKREHGNCQRTDGNAAVENIDFKNDFGDEMGCQKLCSQSRTCQAFEWEFLKGTCTQWSTAVEGNGMLIDGFTKASIVADDKTKDRKRCGRDFCSQTQILQKDGWCRRCRNGLIPDRFGRVCAKSQCTDEQERVNIQGECEMCPAFQMPMDYRTKCGSEGCSGREILLGNGRCRSCPDYLKPNKPCDTYTRYDKCIDGNNLQMVQDTTGLECRTLCNNDPNCKAFELYKDYSTGYREARRYWRDSVRDKKKGSTYEEFVKYSAQNNISSIEAQRRWDILDKDRSGFLTWEETQNINVPLNAIPRPILQKGACQLKSSNIITNSNCNNEMNQLEIFIQEPFKCKKYNDEDTRECYLQTCPNGRKPECDGSCNPKKCVVTALPCDNGLERLCDGTCVDRCKIGFNRNCWDECVRTESDNTFIDPIIRNGISTKFYYTKDKGHCVRDSDGGWDLKLSRSVTLSNQQVRGTSQQNCEQICNVRDYCQAYEDYSEFNYCVIWTGEKGYKGTGHGKKNQNCHIKRTYKQVDRAINIDKNFMTEQGKCQRYVDGDRNKDLMTGYSSMSLAQCQLICYTDKECVAFMQESQGLNSANNCFTFKRDDISDYHGSSEVGSTWRCYKKINTQEKTSLERRHYIHDYLPEKGHCVREMDGQWNKEFYTVHKLDNDSTPENLAKQNHCEKLCNSDKKCIAYEEYYEFKQCISWKQDPLSDLKGNGEGTKTCFIKVNDTTKKTARVIKSTNQYIRLKGKCQRKSDKLMDSNNIIGDSQVQSLDYCQKLCDDDCSCSALLIGRELSGTCQTLKNTMVTDIEGDAGESFDCFMKVQNPESQQTTSIKCETIGSTDLGTRVPEFFTFSEDQGKWMRRSQNEIDTRVFKDDPKIKDLQLINPNIKFTRTSGKCARKSDGRLDRFKLQTIFSAIPKLEYCQQICSNDKQCVALFYNQVGDGTCYNLQRDPTSAYEGDNQDFKFACYVKVDITEQRLAEEREKKRLEAERIRREQQEADRRRREQEDAERRRREEADRLRRQGETDRVRREQEEADRRRREQEEADRRRRDEAERVRRQEEDDRIRREQGDAEANRIRREREEADRKRLEEEQRRANENANRNQIVFGRQLGKCERRSDGQINPSLINFPQIPFSLRTREEVLKYCQDQCKQDTRCAAIQIDKNSPTSCRIMNLDQISRYQGDFDSMNDSECHIKYQSDSEMREAKRLRDIEVQQRADQRNRNNNNNNPNPGNNQQKVSAREQFSEETGKCQRKTGGVNGSLLTFKSNQGTKVDYCLEMCLKEATCQSVQFNEFNTSMCFLFRRDPASDYEGDKNPISGKCYVKKAGAKAPTGPEPSNNENNRQPDQPKQPDQPNNNNNNENNNPQGPKVNKWKIGIESTVGGQKYFGYEGRCVRSTDLKRDNSYVSYMTTWKKTLEYCKEVCNRSESCVAVFIEKSDPAECATMRKDPGGDYKGDDNTDFACLKKID